MHSLFQCIYFQSLSCTFSYYFTIKDDSMILASAFVRPCLVWDGSWASRYRSSWAKYYQRYGRQPETTSLVPSVCCNLYTPKITAGCASAAGACRTGWIAGRMPIWLFGPLSSRLQEAQLVIREVEMMGSMGTPGTPGLDEIRRRTADHEDRCEAVNHMGEIGRSAAELPLGSLAPPTTDGCR